MNFLYLTQLLFLPNKERKAWDFKHEEIDPDFMSKISLLSFKSFPDVHFLLGIRAEFGRILMAQSCDLTTQLLETGTEVPHRGFVPSRLTWGAIG